MNKENLFYKFWFEGVSEFLENKDHEKLLIKCSEKCSESYSLGLYKKAFAGDTPVKEALDFLKKSFDDFDYQISPDKIEIIYGACGCDLFVDGYIKSEKLCRCSELSLEKNWGEIFGPENVRVRNIYSILKGSDKCLFEVRVKQLGHEV